jgi:hypothetical protein
VGIGQINNALNASDQFRGSKGVRHRDVMIHAMIGLPWDVLY